MKKKVLVILGLVLLYSGGFADTIPILDSEGTLHDQVITSISQSGFFIGTVKNITINTDVLAFIVESGSAHYLFTFPLNNTQLSNIRYSTVLAAKTSGEKVLVYGTTGLLGWNGDGSIGYLFTSISITN